MTRNLTLPTNRRSTSPTSSARSARRWRLTAAAVTAWIGFLLYAPLTSSVDAALPSHPRRLEYGVAWNGIPAAGATVEITSGENAGKDSVVVEARAQTNRFVDLFWSFRGTVRATLLADGLKPLHFDYDRKMAGTKYATRIDFDPDGARSVFIKGTQRRELAVDDADVLDPITAVFRARLSGARPGDTLEYDVWTGETRYRVRLHVGDPQPIDVPAGRFRALPVVPELRKIGAQEQLDTRLQGAMIWVADDPMRTLLRIRSELFIGAVTLDLTQVESA